MSVIKVLPELRANGAAQMALDEGLLEAADEVLVRRFESVRRAHPLQGGGRLVDGIAAEPQYLDIFIPEGRKKTFKIDTRRHAFAYVFDGAGKFTDAARPRGVLLEKEYKGEELNIRDLSGNRTLIEFGKGDEISVQAGPNGIRFLLVSGAPIQEPVAWHGPIVMNTKAELQQAMTDLRNGTFIKEAQAQAERFALTDYLTTLAGPRPLLDRMAQGGGPDGSKAADAISAIRSALM